MKMKFSRKVKLLSQQETPRDVLEVVYKTIRTSIEVVVMELGIRKVNRLWSLV